MTATKTDANLLPAQVWAKKLGLDWGYVPTSSWNKVEEVDHDDGNAASPSFCHVVNSERWDTTQLRSWVRVAVDVNPEGLRTVSAVVEEWLWIGAPGPLDILPLPDQRDMFWSAQETAPGIWRQSLACPAGQPVAVMSQLMKMVEWLGVDAPLGMVDTSGNAAARAAQDRADARAKIKAQEEEERLAHNARHEAFLLTPEGRAYKAQSDADWKERVRQDSEARAHNWCQCSGPGCTCGLDPSSPYNPANSHPTREDLQAAYLRGLNERR